MIWEICAAARITPVGKAPACSRVASKKDAVQVSLSPGVAGDMLQEEQAAAARLPPDREHGAHQNCHHAGKGKIRGELHPHHHHAEGCTTADMSPCTWHCSAAEAGVYRKFQRRSVVIPQACAQSARDVPFIQGISYFCREHCHSHHVLDLSTL